jgi:hypothetical protein
VPVTTLKNKAAEDKFVSARSNAHLRDASGHPKVFNSDQEIVLVNRLPHLEAWAKLLTKLGGRHIR